MVFLEIQMNEVYILSGCRTPIGSFLGSLSRVPAADLASCAVTETLKRAGVQGEDIDEVFMGQVLSGGCGQAPTRQAALKGGLPESVPCTGINKVCGSGLQAIVEGTRTIKLGENRLVLAGGMENMSLSPHILLNSRTGVRFGEGSPLRDTMQWDGLRDPYTDRAMGNCAEECVRKYNFSREEQDQFAKESFQRAQQAQREGSFTDEIVSVSVPARKGEIVVEQDEGPGKVNFDKISTLRPAFEKEGTITAANASSISDGAATVLLGGEEYKDRAKFKIVSYAGHAQNPTWFTTAPVEAMKKCLAKTSLKIEEIELFEINEAFAAVTMAAICELELNRDKVNIYGGGISLGHPIGCSGTRIVVTLMTAMERKDMRYGMASLCIGGGEALAIILERMV